MRIGETARCFQPVNRKSAPRWGGPVRILGTDETGVTVKCQSQTFNVARNCVCKEVGEQHVEEVEWGPTSRQPKPMEAVPLRNNISVTDRNEVEAEREKVDPAPSPGVPGENSPSSPAAIPVPDSPLVSAQAPSSPSPSVQLPEPAPSFDRHCAQSQAPVINRAPNGGLTRDQPHERCT